MAFQVGQPLECIDVRGATCLRSTQVYTCLAIEPEFVRVDCCDKHDHEHHRWMTSRFRIVRTPAQSHVVHPWLSSAVYQQLKADADRRGGHVDRLVAQILARVAAHGLTDALLDGLPDRPEAAGPPREQS